MHSDSVLKVSKNSLIPKPEMTPKKFRYHIWFFFSKNLGFDFFNGTRNMNCLQFYPKNMKAFENFLFLGGIFSREHIERPNVWQIAELQFRAAVGARAPRRHPRRRQSLKINKYASDSRQVQLQKFTLNNLCPDSGTPDVVTL